MIHMCCSCTQGTLFAIVPAATCAALNVTGPVPLAKFIEMAAAAAGLTTSQGTNVSNFGVALSSILVTCSETAPQPLTSTADLNSELYCGYQQVGARNRLVQAFPRMHVIFLSDGATHGGHHSC